MSKNIVIQENGQGKQLTVDKLKTNLVGGGSCNWLPEDTVALTTKHLTEDGTYKASDEGYYGYSQVSVSGIGKVYGKDDDGDDAVVDTDGDGNIRKKKLPSSIVITSLPTVTTYADGATIDFTGMVVKAYTKTGALWTDASHPDGVIPANELIFPVTVADKDEASEKYYTNGSGVNTMMLSFVPTWYSVKNPQGQTKEYQIFVHTSPLGTDEDGYPITLYSNGPATMQATILESGGNKRLYVAMLTGDVPKKTDISRLYNNYVTESNYTINGWYPYTHGVNHITQLDKFFGISSSYNQYLTGIPVSTSDPSNVDPTTLELVASTQVIPVQWYVAANNATLETNFNITVT